MAKYRISFSGFAYVEADSAEEAEEMYWDEDYAYEECEVEEVELVDDFTVDLF